MIGTLCTICAIIILTLVLLLGQGNDYMMNLEIVFTNYHITISFLVYSLIIFALGILSASLLSLGQFFDAHSRYNKLKKQYEKTNIGAENADEKIKLLENKIKTLETALKKQLENKE